MDTDPLTLVFSIVKNFYLKDAAKRMHVFVHILMAWSFKFADKELSQKCNILLLDFVLTELLLLHRYQHPKFEKRETLLS